MQSNQQIPALVSVQWLAEAMQSNPRLRVLDASWHMPAAQRDGAQEWQSARIPGAGFFDFDRRICDREASLPHMMPDATLFTSELQALGVNQDSIVVVYDSLGIQTSPRAWWMLRAMGLHNSAVLDGGLPAWKAAGYAVDSAAPSTHRAAGNFIASYQPSLISDAREVLLALSSSNTAVLDARSADRFYGRVAEPRAGLRGGHMPGAYNLPFDALLVEGQLRPVAQLQALLHSIVPPHKRVIATCGSGVTSCVIAFAAHVAGYEDISVYDGSWTEWGAGDSLPVTTTPAS